MRYKSGDLIVENEYENPCIYLVVGYTANEAKIVVYQLNTADGAYNLHKKFYIDKWVIDGEGTALLEEYPLIK